MSATTVQSNVLGNIGNSHGKVHSQINVGTMGLEQYDQSYFADILFFKQLEYIFDYYALLKQWNNTSWITNVPLHIHEPASHYCQKYKELLLPHLPVIFDQMEKTAERHHC